MSYNQTGQRPYGHYNIQQNSRPGQTGGHAGYSSSVRRTPSFDPGDDGVDPVNASGQRPVNDELFMDSQSRQYPPRSTSYGMNAVTPQQQYGQPPAPPQRQSYNPQQYGAPASAPQSQHSPQPSHSFTGSFNSAYQTYNPAAYHQNGQQGQIDQLGPSTPSYQTLSHAPPPPPPPRAYEQSYSNRMSAASTPSLPSASFYPIDIPTAALTSFT